MVSPLCQKSIFIVFVLVALSHGGGVTAGSCRVGGIRRHHAVCQRDNAVAVLARQLMYKLVLVGDDDDGDVDLVDGLEQLHNVHGHFRVDVARGLDVYKRQTCPPIF